MTLAFLWFAVYIGRQPAGRAAYLFGRFPRARAYQGRCRSWICRSSFRSRTSRTILTRLHERLHASRSLPLGMTTRSSSSTTAAATAPFALLEELAAAIAHVKVVRLRRNFGQIGGAASRHRLVAAATSSSPWTATCKTIPPTFPMLLDKLGRRLRRRARPAAKRQDNFFIRKLPSLMGNWLIRKVTGSAHQGHGLHAAGDAPRPGRVAAAVRRDAPLHSGAGPAVRRKLLQIPVRASSAHGRARPSTI